MGKRPVLGVIYILQGMQKMGVDPSPVLRKYGLDLATLDPAAEIDRARELQLLTDLASCIKEPAAALDIGAAYGLAGYGPLVMLFMTCDNAYQAMQAGVRYQALTYLFGELRFEPGAQQSALALRHAGLPEGARRFRIDGEAAGTYKLIRDLQAGLGVDLHPERVELPYPKPPEAERYEAYFHAPVTFGSDAVRFWIANEHLALRFPTADPAAHGIYQAQCEQLLLARKHSGGQLADRVREHLALFSGDLPGAPQVAAALGLAERTLRRQLQDEGVSFRALTDQVRFTKAANLLQHSSESIEQIALSLGYAEPASFIRAFQRWAELTPARYRRQYRGGGTIQGK